MLLTKHTLYFLSYDQLLYTILPDLSSILSVQSKYIVITTAVLQARRSAPPDLVYTTTPIYGQPAASPALVLYVAVNQVQVQMKIPIGLTLFEKANLLQLLDGHKCLSKHQQKTKQFDQIETYVATVYNSSYVTNEHTT